MEPRAPAPAPPPVPGLAEAAEEAVRRARAGRPVLLAWARRCSEVDPLRFLAAGDAPRVLFEAPGGGLVAGLGAAATLEEAGAARFDGVRLRAARLLADAVLAGEPGAPPPRFLGGFAFADAHAPEGAWEEFPGAWFALPALTLVREEGAWWVQVHRRVEGREDPRALARHLAAAAERATQPYPPLPPEGQGVPLPPFGARVLERADWGAAVQAALRAIRGGGLRKVVLARRVAAPLTAPLAGYGALERLAAHYPDCYRYLVEPRGGRPFLGASPELLVRLRAGRLATAAVAGSAPRGADAGEDAKLGEALLGNPKERAEHALVVEHVEARLAAVGASARATSEGPGLLRLRNVQHLCTPFEGTAEGAHLLDLAAALHPTPAVAGAPPQAALDFLDAHEPFPRGWYAGAVGWFDARGDGELAVALRCALVAEGEAWLFAGAGIVPGSDAAREWDETALKLQPMLEALGCKA